MCCFLFGMEWACSLLRANHRFNSLIKHKPSLSSVYIGNDIRMFTYTRLFSCKVHGIPLVNSVCSGFGLTIWCLFWIERKRKKSDSDDMSQFGENTPMNWANISLKSSRDYVMRYSSFEYRDRYSNPPSFPYGSFHSISEFMAHFKWYCCCFFSLAILLSELCFDN